MKKFFGLILVLAIGMSLLFFKTYQEITNEQAQVWTEDPNADCAVVLTGGPNRVREGFDLLVRRQVKKLIVSGVYTNATLREILPQWPMYGDISEKDVVLDRRSTTTFGNAQQSLPLVEALGCRDVILVTSNTHMLRAYRTFRASYPSQIPIVKFAVNPGKGEADFFDVTLEIFRYWFYALWAF